ncbi:hypothetical protein [Wolbachia endosymbiont (group B) of Athalia cordata]|uniref:hypothetical protein n=1 Tax=Wolbachia endosymbiont (group B) of Athalia cordata TaxID=2953986 RepID=UPI0022322469|nr:hypothetical protein [Wolbachia endosymbiont (group B) of Athalia cordata]
MSFIKKIDSLLRKTIVYIARIKNSKIINVLIICGVIFFIYLIHEPVIDMLKGIMNKIKGLF